MSVQSFADLGVSRAVVNALKSQGISEPFAVQRLVIDDVLAGRDVLARSPTGSGKTLAFGIPMVDRIQSDGPRPAALILAPTRELATQIAADIRAIAHARALRVTAVYGGAGLVKQQTDAAASHILVATPGRLEDLLARGAFRLSSIRMLVLDEADRMLDMGFRPAVDRIVNACPAQRQTLFFSATLDGEAGQVARHYTTEAVLHEHGPSARRAAEGVEHRFIAVEHATRLDALMVELRRDRELTLVFVRTKRGADRLVKRLKANGFEAMAMHGNKSQRQREQALARFESGVVDTLVATDVAARGIDVTGISHVINFDPPGDHDSYVHRIGRTARAGQTGVGITLVSGDERKEIALMTRELGIEHGLGGPDHGAGPISDRGPARSSDRGPARGSDRGPRGSDRGPSRGSDRGPSRGSAPRPGSHAGETHPKSSRRRNSRGRRPASSRG
ncbi:MAG: DEAD/DEAH box helicase [Actinomycetota bacterium]|nr:DEAD/DEAH box helicase [Actinomycetota bacterium]